jgi:hypothetical protein
MQHFAIVQTLKTKRSQLTFMVYVGFDSAPIRKVSLLPDGTKGTEFVANLGVSVTVEDKKKFESAYDTVISNAFKKINAPQLKRFYKGAHLVGQISEKAPEVIAMLLNDLTPEILHIDVYCAYYNMDYVSLYGQSETQKLSPPVFVKKTQGAFPHVCAWWYVSKYAQTESPLTLEIDSMQTATTPAWRELSNSVGANIGIEFYFGGDECNPIISLADLILKLIRIFHRGTVEGRSLLAPLYDKCNGYMSKRKAWFHNLGSRGFILKATAPDLNIQANTTQFIKHPITFYYTTSRPLEIKDEIATSIYWSPIYNAMAYHVSCNKGGMKRFSPTEDVHIWDAKKDEIVPLTKQDLDQLKRLETYGYTLPSIGNPKDLVKSSKF